MARYWQRIAPEPKVAQTYLLLIEAADVYSVKATRARTRGNRAAEIEARRAQTEVLTVLRTMQEDYRALSKRTAAEADRLIRRVIEAERVRPARTGQLAEHIHSRSLATNSKFPAGEVGIADLDILDQLAYWRTQEHGYRGFIGRKVPGYFMPGRVRPNPGDVILPHGGKHPFFETTSRGPGTKSPKGTPAMVIKRGIKGKHFLERGAAAAAKEHIAGLDAIEDKVLTRLRLL